MQNAPWPDDWSKLWFLVRRVASLMDRAGESMFRRELGISLAQFLVLSVVDAHPGEINQQAIADRLGLTKGTVSRQIDAAVTAGLMNVAVSPRTRRANTITLTEAGTEMVRRGDATFEQARHTALERMAPDDLAAALRLLASMDEALTASLR
ncbi:MarR family winged helix-turn-helix transcriptional regulator [Nocardia sp. NBC_00416]|uniref:MarR family winged helix-turn-helix transcriptional regulator n=1 Tax=Nocardia sp. NBC_00416 TaxID=2975991 RepID=UPI002E23E237